MDFPTALQYTPLILGGGSMYERLRRHPGVQFDPHIAHAGLFYAEPAVSLLARTHREYIDVAQDAELPILVSAGTWRASRERIERSAFAHRAVNRDHVAWLRRECDEARRDEGPPIYVAGVLGPRNDAYLPEEALDTEEAIRFHAHQADALAETEADVLIAYTLPALTEAMGLAAAMENTGMPYMLSFVVLASGTLLDGTPVAEAIDRIDDDRQRAPLGYLINCVHPSVLDAALSTAAPRTIERIVGLKANTSARAPHELSDSEELLTEPPEVLAPQMIEVRDRYDLRILAGCCGTNTGHMAAIARAAVGS